MADFPTARGRGRSRQNSYSRAGGLGRGNGAGQVAGSCFAIAEEICIGHPLLRRQGQLVNRPVDQGREQSERPKTAGETNKVELTARHLMAASEA